MKHRRLAAQRPRNNIRRHGRDQCRGEDGWREVALKLLEHEHEARQGRVEGRRESGTCARGDKCLPLTGRAAEPLAHELPEGASHLDGGPLASEGEAGPDADDTADELHDEDAGSSHRPQVMQYRLQVGDAASGRLGREGSYEPDSDPSAERPQDDGDCESPGEALARVLDQLGPHCVPASECPGESDRGEACEDTDDDRPRKLPPPLLVGAQEFPDLALHNVGRHFGGQR